jgi:hypothetical protein
VQAFHTFLLFFCGLFQLPSKLTDAGISSSAMAAGFFGFVSLGQVILSDDQIPKIWIIFGGLVGSPIISYSV